MTVSSRAFAAMLRIGPPTTREVAVERSQVPTYSPRGSAPCRRWSVTLAPVIRQTGGFLMSAGDGQDGMIDARDVAATAAVIATAPKQHAGRTYWPGHARAASARSRSPSVVSTSTFTRRSPGSGRRSR